MTKFNAEKCLFREADSFDAQAIYFRETSL